MKITTQTSATPLSPVKAGSAKTAPPPKPIISRVDKPDVSTSAKFLAHNQKALQEMLKQRPEVIRQYAKDVDKPIELRDRTVDRIIYDLQNS